jgi:hypothetical protein
MKKIAISLIALAAVSTAALAAGNHSNDLRDSDTYNGKFANVVSASTPADTFAIKSVKAGSGLTLQELIVRAQEERDVQ